jgi:hypothetical protein
MNRAALVLAVALLPITGTAHAEIRGAWTANPANGRSVQLELSLKHDRSHLGQSIDLGALSGLSTAQLASTVSVPVAFSLRREAGTITFEGSLRHGSGGGSFAFAADPSYLATLGGLGVSLERGKRHGESDEEQLLALAMLDVSTDFIRSMRAAGYDESLDDYLAMRIFKVTPELAADYRRLGMSPSADDLVAGQIHGVSPAYVEQMRALVGRDVSFDDLVGSRIHGATPEFIAQMRGLGCTSSDLDDYVAFRIHGVTPRFIEELAGLGYRDLDADDLVAFRIHGVTAEFIRDVQARGYRDVSADDLVGMRIHGRRR